MLSTWNFAYFRYHLLDFDFEKFKTVLEDLESSYFRLFRDKDFESVDLRDEQTVKAIKEIYKQLSDLKEIRYTGATKVMHLINPKVFMMWDAGIIKEYKKDKSEGKINEKPEGYVNFMRLMQRLWKENKFKGINLGKNTIPRAIDSYNWERYNTTKSKT